MLGPSRTSIAVLALGCLLLAGCNGGSWSPTTPPATLTPPSSTPTTTSEPVVHTFDGDAALDFVKGLALRADGEPRYRMPDSEGQAEGAAYLWRAMDVPGWQRGWQNFTGAQYVELDRRAVAGYGHGNPACKEQDWQALPGWPFHNLYAVKPSRTPGMPTMVLGAHWDSQRNSQNDPDDAKKALPDPGANDGASGVGVLLQLMRELDGIELPFDLMVLMLDGEDGFFDCYPLAGSLYFAQTPPRAVHRFVLLDMVGDPDARFIRESHSTQSDPGMVDLLWRHGRAAGGTQLFTNTANSISDDHLSFIQQGIPSVDIIDAGRPGTFPPQWDTTGDTVDKLSTRTLGIVGVTLLSMLTDEELTAPWPSPIPPKSP